MAQKSNQPALRLRVTAAAESIVRAGHPWVFSDSVRSQNRPGAAGELAAIYDRHDRFLAVGLFDPDSPIRLRVLHTGRPRAINREWWRERIAAACARRKDILDASTTGCRLIHGENDGLPGLVADRYGATLAIKIYTTSLLTRLEELAGLLPFDERLVLRLSRNIQPAAASLGFRDGQVLRGPSLDGPVLFLENGLRFEADVERGQKTGFFLDQRENRAGARSLSAGRSVLNLFSFTGGFSVGAAAGGARSALSLDISEHALAEARRNFELNRGHAAVVNCRHETVQADAFAWLQAGAGDKFDLIVADPPSLARREAERADAIRAYAKLIAASLRRLNPNGVLIACSCSAHVSAAEFFGAAREAAAKSGRRIEEIKTTGQPADHPATFPEGHYLKAIYLTAAD